MSKATSKRTWLVAIAGACLVFSALAPIASAQQSTDQQKCINKINKDASKVSAVQGKEQASCLKGAGKGTVIVAQSCIVADADGKVQAKKDKTTDDDASTCASVPDFGYTGAATANSAAVQAQLDLTSDIFGPDLDAAVIPCATNKDGCKCQSKVLKDVEKLAANKLKEFVKCKQTALKGATVSAADLVACVNAGGVTGSIAADSKGKIQKGRDKLNSHIADACDTPGVTGAFPNKCNSMSGTALGACLDRLVECRMCQTINEMDGISVNCDLFDDGLPNSTCASGAGPPPTPTDTPTTTPTATDTSTPTETPTATPTITPGGPILMGALLKSTGLFMYNPTPGTLGSDAACNTNFPGTHTCTFARLQDAEAHGDLVGLKDVGLNTVTSFWAIDSTHPANTQCTAGGVRWNYQTAHTGVQAEFANLNNGTGDLDNTPTTAFVCLNQRWVGCCF